MEVEKQNLTEEGEKVFSFPFDKEVTFVLQYCVVFHDGAVGEPSTFVIGTNRSNGSELVM